ncbi:MAG: hypothetical protein QOF13_1491, partial [Solirubrobacterales bacterium]|nr:hypothetical protein [Solirubrobacterales bacterium]
GTIDSMDAERLGRVFAPKARGAWHLHELTAGMGLSAFVLFSSVAGILGNPGQSNYAAANSFLDALAAHRLANGLAATSIAWGFWERESGMTAALSDADKARLRRRGMEALSDQRGLAMFDAAILFDRAPALAAPIDAAGLKALAGAQVLPSILSDLVAKRSDRRRATVSLASRLASVPATQHETLVRDLVRAETAAVLGHSSAEEVAIDLPFNELGFDSLAAVELRNRLGAATDMRLPATVVFDHPSVAALAEYLLASVAPGANGDAALQPGEREIREALASLPLSRLRSAGLIDPLLRLANPEAYPESEPEEEDGDRIDTMDVEELLQASGGEQAP